MLRFSIAGLCAGFPASTRRNAAEVNSSSPAATARTFHACGLIAELPVGRGGMVTSHFRYRRREFITLLGGVEATPAEGQQSARIVRWRPDDRSEAPHR
jgi:hypothetical protein